MKKVVLSFLLLLSFVVSAQIHDPVKWKTSVEKVSDTEFDLIMNATIESGWHLYSQSVPENGPIPTKFNFKETEGVEYVGTPSEEAGHEVDDPVFQMVIKFFENKAQFKQRIKVTEDVKKVNGEVEFMVCDDKNCLPPTYVDLSFDLPIQKATAVAAENSEVNQEITPTENEATQAESVVSPTENTVTPVNDKAEDVVNNTTSNKGLLSIFIIAFLSGFAALLTPCVFPMIPLTVSFFTKQSKSKSAGIKNAIFYGLSIIAIYVLLGSLVTGIFGADSLNALSTNVWFNLIFFILLVVFAMSFLGAFEITLPNSWANKVDSQSSKGGIVGILFMALALAIVSFSCTGPIVGTLLVEAASKGGIAPIIGMLGFSLALALPFALFAAFPGWMNSLPKSGGWLNTVKVFLGFLELALAFKFLSNADLVLQLHWLERDIFLAIWIVIFGTLAFYLFGKIQLPHDSPLKSISVGRLCLGILVLSFTVYLIPGLWGAPLKLISGFPPPLHYSESPHGVGYSKTTGTATIEGALPDGAHYGPHDIIAFTDYDLGMAYARKVNKPAMIDFTGHACVNCRKMEDNVWSDPKVLDILNNDVVLISLYVDDKRELPEQDQIISEISGKKLKYIGQKWSEFQILKYKANAQPFYVLIDENEEKLTEPSAYNPNVEDYYNWLQEGISQY